MSQTYACNHCGERSPTAFLVFLHIFSCHMHVDIGLDPIESKDLVSKTFVYNPEYWQVYQIVANSGLWIERN